MNLLSVNQLSKSYGTKVLFNKINFGEKQYKNWIKMLKEYEKHFPKKAVELKKVINNKITIDFSNFDVINFSFLQRSGKQKTINEKS